MLCSLKLDGKVERYECEHKVEGRLSQTSIWMYEGPKEYLARTQSGRGGSMVALVV